MPGLREHSRNARSRDGAVLAFVVLMMLALLALAHGMLLAALWERAASRSAVRDLRLRAAADHALARTLAGGAGPAVDSMEIWDVRMESLGAVGDAPTKGVLRRLGSESWLVEGRALDPSGAETRSARLAWSPDPLARVLALGGVVTVGPESAVTIVGDVDASAPAAVRAPMEAGACDEWQHALAAGYAVAPLSVVAPAADSTAPLSLGLIGFERIRDAAAATVSGTGTPTPADALGECLDEAWVWGDPDRPWRPCGDHIPIRASHGDLEIQGGVGQSLLVVDGDLSLIAGARYYGMVVVRGTLTLRGGSMLEGLALARDGLTVESGSSLVGSACWAVRALAANRGAVGGFVSVSDSRIGPL